MKIAIAGFGAEGRASYKYWSADTQNDITIVDENPKIVDDLPEGVASILGEGAFEKLEDFDLVVRTASLAPKKIKTAGKIWSATNEFFAECPAEIIGVTGTKGKGTVCSLIDSMLRAAGKKVWLVGNIGNPSLDILHDVKPDDIVVFELSSFQLWDLQKAPQTAVLLMLEPEHLDIHGNFEDYIEAKSNIVKHQTAQNRVIFNYNNSFSTKIAKQSAGEKLPYLSEEYAMIRDGAFWINEERISSTDVVALPGNHNLENACAAIAATWQYVQDTQSIESGLSSFQGLPHRLQLVADKSGVSFYDDSISTTPSSSIAALKAFDQPKVIILGGSSKDGNFDKLAQEMLKHDVYAILSGDEASRIVRAFVSAGFSNFETIDGWDMKKIVERSSKVAKADSVVLLSPACASFDAFSSYEDRGDKFQEAVLEQD
jgi:UDP-N-acetylmuramoylalanine--D-glutamate ligase